MLFKGTGLVKWKDRVIANFELSGDNTFETSDPGVIQRLKLLDFTEYVRAEETPKPAEPVAPAVDDIPEAAQPESAPAEDSPAVDHEAVAEEPAPQDVPAEKPAKAEKPKRGRRS